LARDAAIEGDARGHCACPDHSPQKEGRSLGSGLGPAQKDFTTTTCNACGHDATNSDGGDDGDGSSDGDGNNNAPMRVLRKLRRNTNQAQQQRRSRAASWDSLRCFQGLSLSAAEGSDKATSERSRRQALAA